MIDAGGRFSTRFQEESWGFSLEGNAYRYWSEQLREDGSANTLSELWHREQLKSRLTSAYAFSTIRERIRFDKLVVDGREFPIDITHFTFPEALPIISDMQELAKLEYFPQLSSASFVECNLDGNGLWLLCDAAGITNLNLQATQIHYADLHALFKLPALRILRLKDNPQLTDRAAEHLGLLPCLEELQLQETSFTEAGLRELGFMPTLKSIVLSYDSQRFTLAGLTEASRRLRNCEILVKGVGEFSNGTFSGTWPENAD
ncbi:MAG: hypothetical protein J0L53_00145 [Spirochaetes bacterium]|nr:hypothetical protein [Spirochaetota bacterium]